ncbi:hypothetical protein [Kaistella sp.]|uniref:hypothetical protein n=1 Tax=Kaistella sp. TaxID=2782235 RepID=UPI002F95252E
MYNNDSLLTEGKHKFTSLKNIPAKYLLNIAKNTKDELLKDYVERNLDKLEAREFFESRSDENRLGNKCKKVSYMTEKEALLEKTEKLTTQIRSKLTTRFGVN